jgi:tryptophan-rich sensory protein
MLRSFGGLLLFVLTAFAAAAFGALFPPGDWYLHLVKPAWTPPDWLFGPVWTVLYLLIGVSGWLLWRARSESKAALVLWGVQLALNALWSWIFFGLRAPGAALVEILVLLLAIAATVAAAFRSRPLAAWLLVPYLSWVAFAAALNAAIWYLN